MNAAQAEVNAAKNFQQQLTSKAADIGSLSKNMVALLDDREVWPHIIHDSVSAVATGNTADALADDFTVLTKAPAAGVTTLSDAAPTVADDGALAPGALSSTAMLLGTATGASELGAAMKMRARVARTDSWTAMCPTSRIERARKRGKRRQQLAIKHPGR
jgi:hypothetical protein